jgi:hypothetical protein
MRAPVGVSPCFARAPACPAPLFFDSQNPPATPPHPPFPHKTTKTQLPAVWVGPGRDEGAVPKVLLARGLGGQRSDAGVCVCKGEGDWQHSKLPTLSLLACTSTTTDQIQTKPNPNQTKSKIQKPNPIQKAEIAAIRDDVAPAWLKEPLPLEETAARYVRPELRRAFLELCARPAADYVGKFGFKSDLLKVGFFGEGGFGVYRGGGG